MIEQNDKRTSGYSLKEWGPYLEGIAPDLAGQYSTKIESFQNVVDNNLPHANLLITPLAVLMEQENPQGTIQTVTSESGFYYACLEPFNPGSEEAKGLRTISGYPLTEEQILSFINKSVKEANIRKYNLLLIEYIEPLYGGNIRINPDGSIEMEMGPGEHTLYASQNEIPPFSVTREAFTQSFKYHFKDQYDYRDIRRLMLDTLLSTREDEESLALTVGYYEFKIDQHRRPRFQEFRSNPAFYDVNPERLFNRTYPNPQAENNSQPMKENNEQVIYEKSRNTPISQ